MNATDKSADTEPDKHRYDDMLRLPRSVSKTHPPMPLRDRAAQFAPFAALAGHAAAVRETARLTEERAELTENAKTALNEKLRLLGAMADARPEATVTYFRPDGKKAGGAYVRVTGTVKRIDSFEKTLVFCDGTAIPAEDITEIESPLFCEIEDGDC